jgi:hypothetical protein
MSVVNLGYIMRNPIHQESTIYSVSILIVGVLNIAILNMYVKLRTSNTENLSDQL